MNDEKNEYRDEKGKFLPGNPGKPKGSKGYLKKLEEALETIEKKVGRNFFQQVAITAFKNPAVLMAVLKKFIPDRQHIENEGVDQTRVIIMEHAYSKEESSFIDSKIKEWRKEKNLPFIIKDDPNNKLTEEEKLILKKEKEKEFEEIKENIEA